MPVGLCSLFFLFQYIMIFSLHPVRLLSRVLIWLLRAWKQEVNLLDSVVHHSGPFTGASNLYSDMFIKYDTIVMKTDQQQ